MFPGTDIAEIILGPPAWKRLVSGCCCVCSSLSEQGQLQNPSFWRVFLKGFLPFIPVISSPLPSWLPWLVKDVYRTQEAAARGRTETMFRWWSWIAVLAHSFLKPPSQGPWSWLGAAVEWRAPGAALTLARSSVRAHCVCLKESWNRQWQYSWAEEKFPPALFRRAKGMFWWLWHHSRILKAPLFYSKFFDKGTGTQHSDHGIL